MDSYRALDDEDADYGLGREEEPSPEPPPSIGTDERRMQVRAYNYWVSLLGGRTYPLIADLDPANIDDFGPNSVLLDFTEGADDPRVAFVGRALRAECGLGERIRYISDVPSRSLLSRLTDHYLQIIANCAPIGFEAEFLSQRGYTTMYRGILMPFSANGETIDFIYGVINWKEVADAATTATIAGEVDRSAAQRVADSPIWADGPNSEEPAALPSTGFGCQFGDPAPDSEEQSVLLLNLPADAALADRLCFARESAEAVRRSELRSRGALYHALGQAYDFALAAERFPEDYAELLEDAGIKAQARAPMTPVVKLVFGADYDKTRLTEFAAALGYGRREGIGHGELPRFLERFPGGLKGVVRMERIAKRPERKPDRTETLRAALRAQAPIATIAMDVAGDDEFVLLLARREAGGRVAVLAPFAADRPLLDRAVRGSAGA